MAKKDKKIHIIITGGTMDSYYDGTKDTVVPNNHSVIPQYIKSLKLYDFVKFSEVCMKDSRNLTQLDVKKISQTVDKSTINKIIIIHGTYTMPDTGRYLQENLKKKDKTIIITGSMIPLVGFSPSDAGFNIGFSMASLHNLPAGVYVCMNGRVFSPGEVLKTMSEGRFNSILGEK